MLLHVARGDLRKAANLLPAATELPVRLRPLLLAEPGAAAWLVRFSRRVDDTALAGTALRTVEQLAAGDPDAPALRTAALHARSLYECDPDGIARAAAEHHDAWARPLPRRTRPLRTRDRARDGTPGQRMNIGPSCAARCRTRR